MDTATLKHLERVTLLRLRGEHSVRRLESLIAEAEQLAAVDTTGVAPLRSLYDFRPVSLIFPFLLSHPDNPQSVSSIYRNIYENLKCYPNFSDRVLCGRMNIALHVVSISPGLITSKKTYWLHLQVCNFLREHANCFRPLRIYDML